MKATPHQRQCEERERKRNGADKESKIEFAIRIRRAANRAISVCSMGDLYVRRR